MINRVLIRLKIIQIVYAYYQNGSKNLDSAEKELFFSLSKAYDLYNYLLMLMIALTEYAQKRIGAAKGVKGYTKVALQKCGTSIGKAKHGNHKYFMGPIKAKNTSCVYTAGWVEMAPSA